MMYRTQEICSLLGIKDNALRCRRQRLGIVPIDKGRYYYTEEDLKALKADLEENPYNDPDQIYIENNIKKLAELLSKGGEYTAKELMYYIGESWGKFHNYLDLMTSDYPIYEYDKMQIDKNGIKRSITLYGFLK